MIVERDVTVTASDGVALATDVYRPDGDGPWPAVLLRTGYSKDGEFCLPQVALAESGRYAVVIQDVRGLGRSGGLHDLAVCDGPDGRDTVAWIVAQPWSDGRVVMAGASYLGLTQFAAAADRPDGLAAIIPTISGGPFDGFGYHSPGVVQLDMMLAWVVGCVLESQAERRGLDIRVPAVAAAAEATRHATAASDAVLRAVRTGEVANLGTAIAELTAATAARNAAFEAMWAVPLHELTAEIVRIVPWVGEWLAHPDPADGFWADRDHTRRLAGVDVPALHVGGWNDVFIRGTLRQYTALAARRGAAVQRLVVHPYGHTGPGRVGQVPLDLAKHPDPWMFGGSVVSPEPGLGTGFVDEVLAGGPPAGPPVSLYVMGTGEWRAEHEWPLARTTWRRLHLHSTGRAATDPDDGTLTEATPGDERPDRFRYDPRDPVPTRGGTTMGFGRQPGWFDQTDVEDRPDVLTYTTAPLVEDLEVTGACRVELTVSTSAVDTDFTARLVDVGAQALGICDGVTRLRFRPEAPGPVEPGSVQRVTIELSPTAYVFARGHRIRLQISSSNFPLIDPNPNTGRSALLDGEVVVAEQTVFHDGARPSALLLPVIPAAG